jgi:predicted amidohydrolase YtcJ
MRRELERCPEPQRELIVQDRSLNARGLLRDEGLQRTLGAMREQRLAQEQERARGREIERRGITPLREFQRDPQYGRDRERAGEAWARHAAGKGLSQEHLRDELVKERQRSPQPVPQQELERLAQLAEREVKRARGLEHDRGLGWSR